MHGQTCVSQGNASYNTSGDRKHARKPRRPSRSSGLIKDYFCLLVPQKLKHWWAYLCTDTCRYMFCKKALYILEIQLIVQLICTLLSPHTAASRRRLARTQHPHDNRNPSCRHLFCPLCLSVLEKRASICSL